MILPLFVFLVVLIAVLVSFKREHFQTTLSRAAPQKNFCFWSFAFVKPHAIGRLFFFQFFLFYFQDKIQHKPCKEPAIVHFPACLLIEILSNILYFILFIFFNKNRNTVLAITFLLLDGL